MTTRKQYTAAEKQAWKEAKEAEQDALLDRAFLGLDSTDAWENWVKYARPNLKNYSWLNALLIQHQKPGTWLVHGKKQWENLDVHLNEGCRQIHILAPMFVNRKDKNGNVMYDGEGKPLKRVGWYKTVNVYDVRDTDSEFQSPVPTVTLEGDDLLFMTARLEQALVDAGVSLNELDEYVGLPVNTQVYHMIRKVFLSWDYSEYEDDAQTINFLVESSIVLTLAWLGFDVREEVIPRIAFLADGDRKQLERYVKVVEDLTKTMRKVLGI